MSKKIYVGNLSFDTTEEQVRQLFAVHGPVASVVFINDRDTDRFRGFGFVEMDDEPAVAAIKALDGKELDGRALRVNEAQPRENRPPQGQRNDFGRRKESSGNRGGRRWYSLVSKNSKKRRVDKINPSFFLC